MNECKLVLGPLRLMSSSCRKVKLATSGGRRQISLSLSVSFRSSARRNRPYNNRPSTYQSLKHCRPGHEPNWRGL